MSGPVKTRTDKSPATKARRDKKIERKLEQLSKDHPENEYEVKEITVTDRKKNKDYKLINIIRNKNKGRRPHKTKDQQKASRENKKTRTVKV